MKIVSLVTLMQINDMFNFLVCEIQIHMLLIICCVYIKKLVCKQALLESIELRTQLINLENIGISDFLLGSF